MTNLKNEHDDSFDRLGNKSFAIDKNKQLHSHKSEHQIAIVDHKTTNRSLITKTRSVSNLFLTKRIIDPTLPIPSTPVTLCRIKIQKCQDHMDKEKKEIKSQDIIINELRQKIDTLKRFTGVRQAASMKSMNLNLQLDLTPTIQQKNKLKDKHENLMASLKKAKERENELNQSIERVKLKGRQIRVEFYSRANKLENETEKWKIPLIRMDLCDKIFKNNSLASAKILLSKENKVCFTTTAIFQKEKSVSLPFELSRLQRQNIYLSYDLETLEDQERHWDEVKDAEQAFGSLSQNIIEVIQAVTSSLDPWISMVNEESTDDSPTIILSVENCHTEALQKISETFDTSQFLLKTWRVLYSWLKSRLVYLYNNFCSDVVFFKKTEQLFKELFEKSLHEKTKLSHFLFQFPIERSPYSPIETREEKVDETELLNCLLKEQKDAVACLRNMLSISRKGSKKLMLSQISQMNEINSSMNNSSSKLSSLEKNASMLALSCDEHEGRIRILEIMKVNSSTDVPNPRSIFWSIAKKQ